MAISPIRPGPTPWQALQRLREEMDGIIGSMLPGTSGDWSPPIDLEDREGELVLTAELPGMRPDEIDLEIEGDTLTMRGEKREEREEKREGERLFLERRYGSFVRRISLPQSVDPDQARAHFENGILRVTLPKREGPRGRKLQVEGGGTG